MSSFKATAAQNEVNFTVFEANSDGSVLNLLTNLELAKKKTEEYYNKILSNSNFKGFCRFNFFIY